MITDHKACDIGLYKNNLNLISLVPTHSNGEPQNADVTASGPPSVGFPPKRQGVANNEVFGNVLYSTLSSLSRPHDGASAHSPLLPLSTAPFERAVSAAG